jgi:FkbM family methyltransferase
VWLATRTKAFRRLVAPGQEFVFDRYLGELRVVIDVTYPIEVQMMSGSYDPDSSALIRRLYRPDWVSMDVGANVGALTLLMAQLSPKGEVTAVEPGPVICSRLRRNLELNPQLSSRVAVFELGLSDQPGRLFWSEDQGNRGNAGLLGAAGQSVPVVTLDELVRQRTLSRLDFLKIDVEGMELEVIKGATASIQRFRPILYYETLAAFNQVRGFDVQAAVSALMASLGYREFSVLSGGRWRPHAGAGERSSNTLAVPSERMDEFER